MDLKDFKVSFCVTFIWIYYTVLTNVVLLLGSKVACSYSWRCKWQYIHCWHHYSDCSFCWWGIFH